MRKSKFISYFDLYSAELGQIFVVQSAELGRDLSNAECRVRARSL